MHATTVAGLRNQGHVCYFNSTLQALASCDVLLRALDTFRSEIGAPAADTPILTALHDILIALRPQEADKSPSSLSPQPLLALLRSFFASAATAPLSPGEEHDVSEACELLMQAVSSEAEAAFHKHAQSRLEARAALQRIISLTPVPDAALEGWRAARMPYEGLISAQMQCVRCMHHFSTHYSPFTALSMPLPSSGTTAGLGVLRVKPGASLASCFEVVFGYELVAGVECPGCSIKGSLEAAGLTPPKPPAPTSPRAVAEARKEAGGALAPRKSTPPSLEAAHDLWRSVAERGPLPDGAAIAATLAAAGAQPRVTRSQVSRRNMVSRWPPLLALHLRRAFWTPQGQHVKVVGPLRFPMRLAVQGGDGQPVVYLLHAVVEHAGFSSNSGHYVTYRSVGEEKSSEAVAAAAAGKPPRRQWVRVSDEDVRAVAESDVVAAHASMLFYQRIEVE